MNGRIEDMVNVFLTHAMKSYRQNGGVTPIIFRLGTEYGRL
jgi:hypothetical protein